MLQTEATYMYSENWVKIYKGDSWSVKPEDRVQVQY